MSREECVDKGRLRQFLIKEVLRIVSSKGYLYSGQPARANGVVSAPSEIREPASNIHVPTCRYVRKRSLHPARESSEAIA